MRSFIRRNTTTYTATKQRTDGLAEITKKVCVKIGWNANSLRRLEGVLSKVLSTFENPVNNERPDEVQLDDVVSGDPA